MDHQPSDRTPLLLTWWMSRHPTLAVGTMVVALVSIGVAVLLINLAMSSGSTSDGVRHESAGDVVFFGLFSALVVVAAIVIRMRLREDRTGTPSEDRDPSGPTEPY